MNNLVLFITDSSDGYMHFTFSFIYEMRLSSIDNRLESAPGRSDAGISFVSTIGCGEERER